MYNMYFDGFFVDEIYENILKVTTAEKLFKLKKTSSRSDSLSINLLKFG